MLSKKKIKKIIATMLIIAGIVTVVLSQILIIKDNNISESIESDFALTQTSPHDEKYNSENIDDTFSLDWDKLKNVNSDVIAWIKIPGIEVNQPILKGDSNKEYLRHNIYHKYSHNGSIFISENTTEPFNEVNTVIYGHNLGNGTMFSNLKKYRSINFRNENPYIYIYFPDNSVKQYEIISFHTVNDADKNIFGTYYTNFDEFEPYINENNIYKDIDYDKDNVKSVITLSTCTNRKSDERYVLHAIAK